MSVDSGRTDTYGVYLMHQYATTGRMPNNYRFSPCSVRLMYPVIVHKGHCLLAHHVQLCGNGFLEEGEECDCGNSHVCDFNDPCCTPGDVANSSADPPCTVRRSRGKACSPLSGPCCLHDCQVARPGSLVCAQATECHNQSLCDGHNGTCPLPVVKPDGTTCRAESHFCTGGQCLGNVCQMNGFIPCLCSSTEVDRCKICCKGNLFSDCLPAQMLDIRNIKGQTIYLFPGESCSDGAPAFCDKNHVCVSRSKSKSLRSLLNTSKIWAKKYWPYLLLLVVAFLLVILFKTTSLGHDDAHMQALHYGKIMGIFQIADSVGVQNTRDIAIARYLFDNFLRKAAKGKLQMYSVEAVSRLRTFFPTCPLAHIISAIEIASSEDVVVRVLLAQGFPLRRFTPKLTQSEFAHLAHLLPRGALFSREKEHSEQDSKRVNRELMKLNDLLPSASTFSLSESALRDSSVDTVDTVIPVASIPPHGQSFSGTAVDIARGVSVGPSYYRDYLKHFQSELAHSRQQAQEVVGGRVGDMAAYESSLDKTKLPTLAVSHLEESDSKVKSLQRKLTRKQGIIKTAFINLIEKKNQSSENKKVKLVMATEKSTDVKDKTEEMERPGETEKVLASPVPEKLVPREKRGSVFQTVLNSLFDKTASKMDARPPGPSASDEGYSWLVENTSFVNEGVSALPEPHPSQLSLNQETGKGVKAAGSSPRRVSLKNVTPEWTQLQEVPGTSTQSPKALRLPGASQEIGHPSIRSKIVKQENSLSSLTVRSMSKLTALPKGAYRKDMSEASTEAFSSFQDSPVKLKDVSYRMDNPLQGPLLRSARDIDPNHKSQFFHPEIRKVGKYHHGRRSSNYPMFGPF
ncbi:hypothetical protein ACOMHN_018005 [Nucella lapillus]